jgi:hypothetical protein
LKSFAFGKTRDFTPVRERAIAFRVSLKFIEDLLAPKDISQNGKEKANNKDVEI